MGNSAAWQRPVGWMARWGAKRTRRGTRSQGLERGTGYLSALRWLYLWPQHQAPALVFAQWEPQLGRMGRSERQGGGRQEGGGVTRGEGCGVEIALLQHTRTHQVACTTGTHKIDDVRLVPRTCSTKSASQPGSFRPTGDARCCWRWGAKYLRRAGTCPRCLARCDASVMPLQPPPLGTRLRASWKLWAGGGGTVKVAVAVVFSLSFFVETVRSTEPSIPQAASANY